ncbi:hypothetical protein ACP3P6_14905 [Enterobacter mori]
MEQTRSGFVQHALLTRFTGKLMRHVLLMCLLLTGCATQMITPEKRTHDFYTFYLMAFVTDSKEDNLDSLKMRDYIAQDTLSRLQKISSL